MSQRQVYLSGWSAYHPEGRLTNDDLVDRLDTTHEWLEAKIGIRERRKAEDGETIASMGARAAQAALAQAGLGVGDIDLIIGATSFDDVALPAAAARIGDAIGCQAHAFDVKAACSGWMVGLDVADSFLATGKAERILVCAGEHSATGVDPDDRASASFFGDASVAAVVQRERPSRGLELIDLVRDSDNAMHDAVEVPYAGWFRMDAHRTRLWVEAAVAKASNELLDRAGLEAGDLRAFVCHQANLRLLEHVAGHLHVPAERHWHNVEWAGNTASAGAPSALFDALEREHDDLADGDPILVVTVGAGLNVIGALLRWVTTSS